VVVVDGGGSRGVHEVMCICVCEVCMVCVCVCMCVCIPLLELSGLDS